MMIPCKKIYGWNSLWGYFLTRQLVACSFINMHRIRFCLLLCHKVRYNFSCACVMCYKARTECGGKVPYIFNIGTRWWWLFNFVLWPLYAWGERALPTYGLEESVGPRVSLYIVVKRKIPAVLGIKSWQSSW